MSIVEDEAATVRVADVEASRRVRKGIGERRQAFPNGVDRNAMDKAHRGGGESVGDVEIGNAVQGHGNMSGGYKVNAFALMVDDEQAAIRSGLPPEGDAA